MNARACRSAARGYGLCIVVVPASPRTHVVRGCGKLIGELLCHCRCLSAMLRLTSDRQLLNPSVTHSRMCCTLNVPAALTARRRPSVFIHKALHHALLAFQTHRVWWGNALWPATTPPFCWRLCADSSIQPIMFAQQGDFITLIMCFRHCRWRRFPLRVDQCRQLVNFSARLRRSASSSALHVSHAAFCAHFAPSTHIPVTLLTVWV